MSTAAATAAAAPSADSCAAAAITREPGPANGRAVCAPIVFGDDFDVEVTLASIDVAIVDAAVRKMDLPFEEREVVVVCPLRDLAFVAVGPAVGIRSVAIAFVKPLLVLALQLVVEPHSLDLQATRLEPCRLAFIGAIDLRVVFELALAFEPGVERLTSISVAVAIRFQQAPTTVREHDCLLAIAGNANRFDQPLFSEMAEVAIANVARPVITIAEIASWHDAKGADRGQRPTLGSSQPVFTIARVADYFPVTTPRQVEAAGKHLTRIGATVPRIAIALRPSGILAIAMVGAVRSVMPMVIAFTFVMVLRRRTGAASERHAVVIVVPITLVPVPVAWDALIAVVAWIEVHHTSAEANALAVLADDMRLRRMFA
jgi:hypothetical protein